MKLLRTARQQGFTMLEILVSLLIIVFGLLGMLGLQAQATVAEFESYQRGQALILAQDMIDRINANRKAGLCYAFTDLASGAPQLGAGSATPVCAAAVGTPVTRAMATQDLNDWHEALRGAAERTGGATGTRVGTMLNARGCVSYDPLTQLYRVSVVWQGMSATFAPLGSCGINQYHASNDGYRREVMIEFRMANLTAP